MTAFEKLLSLIFILSLVVIGGVWLMDQITTMTDSLTTALIVRRF